MVKHATQIGISRLCLLSLAIGMMVWAAVSHAGAPDVRGWSSAVALTAGSLLLWLGWSGRTALAFQPAFWRLWFVGLVAITVACMFVVGGRDDARDWLLAASACWSTLLTALFGWSSLPLASGRWPALRWFDLAATNLAIAFVLAELALRAYGTCTGQQLLLNQQLDGYRLQPNREYGGLLFTNSHGYASREFVQEKRPGVQRIALLGDSFAVGTVRQEMNFANRLEAALGGVEIYNFGIAGTGPREYDQILREEVWPFRPDLVLVSLFVGNDVLGYWRPPGSDRLDPNACRVFVLCERTWRLARERLRREREPLGVASREELCFPPLSRQSHLEHEAARLAVCRHSEAARTERAWNRTLLYLDRIRTQCRERGVPLGVILIPDEFQVSADLLAETLEFRGIPREDVDLDLPQRRLTAYFADRNAPCLDLLPRFHGRLDTYKPRDTHWNEKGNLLAAEAIADWLKRERLTMSSSW